MNQSRTICAKCVLPENLPDIRLDEQGVCSVCRAWEAERVKLSGRRLLETDFIKLLNQHKSKGPYDCLVMLSGGKDSTASLYYMKKRYKKNPLVFTFDHGLETEEALENIRNAVNALGVDHVLYKSDFMKEMFAEMARTDSRATICHVCSIWYMGVTFDMAARFDVPVIIAGWTRGQVNQSSALAGANYNDSQPEFAAMARATREFLDVYTRQNPKYKDFPRSMEEVIKRAERRHKAVVLSPHWFLPQDSSEYVELIKKELNWKSPQQSYPSKSTNCFLNFLSVHNSMRHFGYTHYHVEMSKMIRQGLMTRDEALKLLERNFDESTLAQVKARLGCAGCCL